MSYKITKSETKKIGTIKLPKGVWLKLEGRRLYIQCDSDVFFYIDSKVIKQHLIEILSNYVFSAEEDIILRTNIKIDYNCTKLITTEWTFYEKIEDTVKVNPNTPEEIWADAAYTFAKSENTFTIHGCIDDSWLSK